MRHSISRAPPLALEASDATAEMRDPGQAQGQGKKEWWQTRHAPPPAAVDSGQDRKMRRSVSSGRLQQARPGPSRLQRSKTGLQLNQVGESCNL